MERESIKQFYISQLEHDFFPYWSAYEDLEWGGILNCINNYGDQKLSDNKFTWSQGRWLWILGRLYNLREKGVMRELDREQLLRWMESTYQYIIRYSIYDGGKCCYLLTREGKKLPDQRTGRYDASIYADCFALIGMAQYIKVTRRADRAAEASRLYESIVSRIEDNDFLTEPYPIPDGYVIHGIPMILVNTVYEYYQMLRELGLPYEQEQAYAIQKARFILDELYDEPGIIREHKSVPERRDTHVLDRHVNPGHTLEDMWFLAETLEDGGLLEPYLPKICRIAAYTFELGWDSEYGGLLRFVDREGGRPRGRLLGAEPCAYEALMMDTWDMKLWWPHSEILYVFLLLYEKTGDPEMLRRYETAREYVMKTFPNKDTGEWIQIRSRDGSPQEKLVALPVKDPFHIMRNFIKIVELYSGGLSGPQEVKD